MNFKQKLGYMFIGCLFTIAGYILASLGGGATHAQQKEQVIDKFVCRKLEVVNKEGKRVLNIGVDANGDGEMVIRDAAGYEVVNIAVTENGGVMFVRDAAGRSFVEIFSTNDGGIIAVSNAAGNRVAGIVATENGGSIEAKNAARKAVAIMAATEDGNGVIQTYKGGWRTH